MLVSTLLEQPLRRLTEISSRLATEKDDTFRLRAGPVGLPREGLTT